MTRRFVVLEVSLLAVLYVGYSASRLLASNDRAEALDRARALLGLARARRRLGDAAGSRIAYERVLRNWQRADATVPELREVRTALGRP